MDGCHSPARSGEDGQQLKSAEGGGTSERPPSDWVMSSFDRHVSEQISSWRSGFGGGATLSGGGGISVWSEKETNI